MISASAGYDVIHTLSADTAFFFYLVNMNFMTCSIHLYRTGYVLQPPPTKSKSKLSIPVVKTILAIYRVTPFDVIYLREIVAEINPLQKHAQ